MLIQRLFLYLHSQNRPEYPCERMVEKLW